jgi:hypothetical protein
LLQLPAQVDHPAAQLAEQPAALSREPTLLPARRQARRQVARQAPPARLLPLIRAAQVIYLFVQFKV